MSNPNAAQAEPLGNRIREITGVTAAGLTLASLMLAGCTDGAPAAPTISDTGVGTATPTPTRPKIPGATDDDRACHILLLQDGFVVSVTEGDINTYVKDTELADRTRDAFRAATATTVAVKATGNPREAMDAWRAMPADSYKAEAGKVITDEAESRTALYAADSKIDAVAADAHAIIDEVNGAGTPEAIAADAQVDELVAQGKEAHAALGTNSSLWRTLTAKLSAIRNKLSKQAYDDRAKLSSQAISKRAPICDPSPEYQELLAEIKADQNKRDHECETAANPDACKADRAISAAKDGLQSTEGDLAKQVDPNDTVQQQRMDVAEADQAIADYKTGLLTTAETWAARVQDPAQLERIDQARADAAIDAVNGGLLTTSFSILAKIHSSAARDRIDAAYSGAAINLAKHGSLALANDLVGKIRDSQLRKDTALAVTDAGLHL